MPRRFAATGVCLLLAACAGQAPPRYAGRPVVAYPVPGYAPPAPQPAPPRRFTPSAPEPITPPPQASARADEPPPKPVESFAEETLDQGVPPTHAIRRSDFDAPTPTKIAGARTITTMALRAMLDSDRPPVLIDVIGGPQSVSLPNAIWLRDAGQGRHLDDDIQAWFDWQLAHLTGRDKSRPLVIFCASRICWLAHNAAIRAVDLGYTEVYWYRGGRDAWQEAGLPMAPVAPPPP